MKLLIITQKVDINDDNLGFFHGWVEKFSEKYEKIHVICLGKGEYNLPKNVHVYSLGKESGASKIRQLFRLQKYLVEHLGEVDGVFVHMCPTYAIASFPLTMLYGKKMIMWFTHKSRNWKLWLAEKLVKGVLTASRESFRMKSKKVDVVGHGINTTFFCPEEEDAKNHNFVILTAGRIVPSKDLETQILAIDILVNKENIENIEMRILGSAFPEEYPDYLNKLKNLVQEKGLGRYVFFDGSVQVKNMPERYQESNLVINSSKTGSIDKSVLEAMACGVLVFSSNESFYPVLSDIEPKLLFREGDYKGLANNIKWALSLDENIRSSTTYRLRDIVIRNHNLDNLADNIYAYFSKHEA